MTLTLTVPNREPDAHYERTRMMVQSWRGESGLGIAFRNTEVSDDDSYAGDFQNAGAGTRALRARGGSHSLIVDGTGVTVSSLVATGNLVVGGNATVGGTFGVTGASTLGVLNAGATTVTNLTATGNVALGDANADAHTMIGIWTFQNVAGAVQAQIDSTNNRVVLRGTTTRFRDNATGLLVPLFVDHDNNRAIFGSATALSSAADDKVSVVGGALHIATDATGGGDELAQGWRYGIAGSSYGLYLSGASNPELIFKGDSGAETIRFGDPSGAYQLNVTGDANVTDAISAARAVLGTGSFSGSEELRVSGQTRLEGTVDVTTGGLNVTGGIVLASSGNIDGNGGTAGQLRIGAVIVNGSALAGSEELRVVGQSQLEGAVTVTTGGIAVTGNSQFTGAVDITGDCAFGNATSDLIRFYDGTLTARQTVTGSRGGNAALASLLSALNTFGLIIDSSS